jgi:hypothetical protein
MGIDGFVLLTDFILLYMSSAFFEKVKPIFTLSSTLGEQNTKPLEARDILLPKWMRGQVDVRANKK